MTATTRPAQDRIPDPPRELWRPVSWVILVLLVAWSLWGLDARWERLLDAPADLWDLGKLLFGDMAFDRTDDLLVDMWESIAIAWLGTIMAAVVALPLSFLAAENLVGKATTLFVRQILNVLRAIPEVILAIAFIPLLGLTPMAGVMAITIGSIGTLGGSAQFRVGLDFHDESIGTEPAFDSTTQIFGCCCIDPGQPFFVEIRRAAVHRVPGEHAGFAAGTPNPLDAAQDATDSSEAMRRKGRMTCGAILGRRRPWARRLAGAELFESIQPALQVRH